MHLAFTHFRNRYAAFAAHGGSSRSAVACSQQTGYSIPSNLETGSLEILERLSSFFIGNGFFVIVCIISCIDYTLFCPSRYGLCQNSFSLSSSILSRAYEHPIGLSVNEKFFLKQQSAVIILMKSFLNQQSAIIILRKACRLYSKNRLNHNPPIRKERNV